MLSDQVLVLNKTYSPINVCSIKRALSMLIQDKAEVVTVEEGTYCNYDIHSWSEFSQVKRELNFLNDDEELLALYDGQIIIPRVIRVLHYGKVPSRKVRLNRKNIYLRDNNTCQYCGKQFEQEDLNLDHILPRAQGGTSTWLNLVCSCYKCNTKKAAKTPEQAGMKLIRKPYEPKGGSFFNVNNVQNRVKYQSWKNFVSDIYWQVTLEE